MDKNGKTHKTWLYVLLTCIVLFVGTGCSSSPQASSGTAAASGPTPAPAAVTSQEVTCDWTLTINDTVSTKVNGYDLTCKLNVQATKIGGKTENGTYGGSVALSYEYDMQRGGISGNSTGSGNDPTTVIDVVAYAADKYADTGEDGAAPLAPVIEYDAMALGNFSITGTGLAKESAGGADWSKQESRTVSVPYKIAVVGGQIVAELPSIAPGVQFKGTLTGTPR